MIGQYTVQRKVADLPEGYEFQENRFIADKNDRGCHVQYRSQEGDMRYIMVGFKSEFASKKSWMDANGVIDCIVDFVPDDLREFWKELQKLGKCYLEFLPYEEGAWQVSYPENHNWMTKFNQSGNGDFNLTDRCGPTTEDAITNMIEDFRRCELVHNGYRWFDCRDVTNFKKISDDEAKKLMEDNG